MRIKSIALALALACAGAQSALAAGTVTAPVIVDPYYEQNGSASCTYPGSSGSSGESGTATMCRIDYALPPAGKLLSITHVSCFVRSSGSPVSDLYLTITRSGVDGRIQRLDPTLKTQSGSQYGYLLAQDTQYVVASGPSIVMKVLTFGELTMECQIVGTLANKT